MRPNYHRPAGQGRPSVYQGWSVPNAHGGVSRKTPPRLRAASPGFGQHREPRARRSCGSGSAQAETVPRLHSSAGGGQGGWPGSRLLSCGSSSPWPQLQLLRPVPGSRYFILGTNFFPPKPSSPTTIPKILLTSPLPRPAIQNASPQSAPTQHEPHSCTGLSGTHVRPCRSSLPPPSPRPYLPPSRPSNCYRYC